MREYLFALVMMTVAAPTAWAQEGTSRDRLIDLITLDVVRDLCHFDMTDDQEAALGKAEQALYDEGALTEADGDAVRADLTVAMTRQVPEGLCRPNGAEAKYYKQKLAELAR